MPTYRRAHDGLLARAITSVLSQTFSDFEFIIVDDGSVDGSEDIIREFQKQDERILYVRHEVNSGLPALRCDEGIMLGRAEYLAFQFDDEEWLPLFLQAVTGRAKKRGIAFVHCQVEYSQGDRIRHPSFPATQPTYASLLQSNKIANASVLLHRTTLMRSGLYDPHVVLRRTVDWDLWLRVARSDPPCLVPEVLVRIRGDLPDSIGIQTPRVDYEDFMLMSQVSRSADLMAERIVGYDVMSLDRYTGKLPPETIRSFYCNLVLPWLTQREEQLVDLGVSFEEITRIKQEIAAYSGGTEPVGGAVVQPCSKEGRLPYKNAILTKEKSSSGIAAIRGLFRRLMHPFVLSLKLARVSYRSFCSIPAVCRNLTRSQDDAYHTLPLGFQGIKDDALMLSCRKRGFTLHKSCNLQDVPLLCYKINAKDGSVSAILLGLVVEDLKARGTVAVAAVSQRAQVAGYAMMPLFLIDREKPVEFFFEPPLKADRYYVIILGKNLYAPVCVLEFRKYRVIKKPFFRLVLA